MRKLILVTVMQAKIELSNKWHVNRLWHLVMWRNTGSVKCPSYSSYDHKIASHLTLLLSSLSVYTSQNNRKVKTCFWWNSLQIWREKANIFKQRILAASHSPYSVWADITNRIIDWGQHPLAKYSNSTGPLIKPVTVKSWSTFSPHTQESFWASFPALCNKRSTEWAPITNPPLIPHDSVSDNSP